MPRILRFFVLFIARRPQRFGRKCPVFVGWGAVDSNFTWFAAEWLGMDFGCVAVDCMKMILGGMMENKTMCGIVCCFLNAVTSTKCVAWLRRMTGKAGNLALFFWGLCYLPVMWLYRIALLYGFHWVGLNDGLFFSFVCLVQVGARLLGDVTCRADLRNMLTSMATVIQAI